MAYTFDGYATTRPPASGTTRVDLVEHDPNAEAKVLAAAAYPHSTRGLGELRTLASEIPAAERATRPKHLAAFRGNRRHKPSRALEHAEYVFEIEGDYGAFRDLQRHRLITIEWQPLSTVLGWTTPAEVAAISSHGPAGTDALSDWNRAIEAADRLHRLNMAHAGADK